METKQIIEKTEALIEALRIKKVILYLCRSTDFSEKIWRYGRNTVSLHYPNLNKYSYDL